MQETASSEVVAAAAPLVSVSFAAGALHRLVRTCSRLVDEIPLDLNPDGSVRVKFVEPAHVAMACIDLSAPYVQARVSSPTRITLDLDRIGPLLPGLPQGDRIELQWERRGAGGVAKLRTRNGVELEVVCSAPENILDPKMPSLSFVASAMIAHTTVGPENEPGWLNMCQRVSDHVLLEVKGGVLTATAGDLDDGSRLRVRVGLAEGEGRGYYSLDYLVNLAHLALAWTGEATIRLSQDQPIEIEDADEGVLVRAMLAPRLYPED